jgi:CRP/FNR family cyclic AMP-dependent transcriptional regulator
VTEPQRGYRPRSRPSRASSSHIHLREFPGTLRAVEEVLRSAPLFDGMPAADVDGLVDRFEMISVQPPGVVFRQGDTGRCLYVVLCGKVKLERAGADGRVNFLLDLMGAADQFGELSLIDHGLRTVTATAVTRTALARLPEAALQEYVQSRPLVAARLLSVLAGRLRRSESMAADLIFLDVPGRVAKQLLDLARRFGVDDPRGLRVQHDLTQDELARLVGGSRETLNKTLAEFAARGWVQLERKSVLILDPARLAGRAATAAR